MINASGFIKDHLWIKQQCKAVIAELKTVSENTSVIGFVMDSASANRKAYEEMHKEWSQQGGSRVNLMMMTPWAL
jgi:hypothetical protein